MAVVRKYGRDDVVLPFVCRLVLLGNKLTVTIIYDPYRKMICVRGFCLERRQ